MLSGKWRLAGPGRSAQDRADGTSLAGRSPTLTASRLYAMVCERGCGRSRASVYRSLKETPPNTIARRPGPVGACSGAELADHIRRQIAASCLHGEGTASYGRDCALLAFA